MPPRASRSRTCRPSSLRLRAGGCGGARPAPAGPRRGARPRPSTRRPAGQPPSPGPPERPRPAPAACPARATARSAGPRAAGSPGSTGSRSPDRHGPAAAGPGGRTAAGPSATGGPVARTRRSRAVRLPPRRQRSRLPQGQGQPARPPETPLHAAHDEPPEGARHACSYGGRTGAHSTSLHASAQLTPPTGHLLRTTLALSTSFANDAPGVCRRGGDRRPACPATTPHRPGGPPCARTVTSADQPPPWAPP